ncbi:hypothetical protein DPMN_165000 [Dreissena polymorpha]|uniref:Uncharacterized protein n=1 Tax=Dreissena polymorpha TaxID=45954 RepID=A0A9D4EW12_DREPO|nr:hypothetical protein DPMN_165000 [Dreissena polymorpha]
MWTDGQRTKTNPKTSPEQSAIFQLVQEINKTNAKYVTSKEFDHKENCPTPGCHKTAPGSHVIQLTGTIFKLHSRIKETNVLTKFHENWAEGRKIEKNAPPTCGHVF